MSYGTGVFIIIATILVSGAGVFLVRRVVTLEVLKRHHEIGTTIFLQVGVVYGVLLAFVVSVVWEQFDQAAQSVDREAAELITTFHLARGLPSPARTEIQEKILEYAKVVVEEEWDAMDHRRESPKANGVINQLWDIYTRFEPRGAREVAVYSESLSRLSSARESRRLRMFQMNLAAPTFLWTLLVIIGVMVVGLSYFFGVEYLWSQAIMTGALAGTIAFILVTIELLDRPFSGSLRVSSQPFELLINGLAVAVAR